jgi:hypothetical protein
MSPLSSWRKLLYQHNNRHGEHREADRISASPVKEVDMDIVVFYFFRAWLGIEEYQEAQHKRLRTGSFPLRFGGRLLIASIGVGFFLWQQFFGSREWWKSELFAALVLCLALSQAAGPCFYLLFRSTVRFFLTKHYLNMLGEGRFYLTLKSALSLVLVAWLSALAAYGVLGNRWYIKLFVFFLTFPVVWFFLILPALNWVEMRLLGFPKSVRHNDVRSKNHS